MSSRQRKLVLNVVTSAVIASMYFVLVFALSGISFLPFQFRIADMLVMLPSVIGLPAVYGVTLGCFVANAFAPYGANPIDMSLGSLANFLAGYVVYKITCERESYKALILSSILASIIITVIVGSYLPIVVGTDTSLETILLIGWLGVLPGEVFSIILLGVPVSKVLKRSFKFWKRGPKVVYDINRQCICVLGNTKTLNDANKFLVQSLQLVAQVPLSLRQTS